MALFAVQIPEYRRVVLIGIVGNAEFLGTGLNRLGMLEIMAPGHRDAGKIALHVGEENRNALRGELFGDCLQGYRLAGTGRSRDQPVTIGAGQSQNLSFPIGAKAQKNIVHDLLRIQVSTDR